jgi:hypothetical protein
VSYRPDLAALLVDPARVAALTDAVYRVALVDLLEVRALVGAVFGDGVRVVSSGPVGPWPPPGAWVPTSARTIDVYGAEMPTVPCPCCRALDWHNPAATAAGYVAGVVHDGITPPASAPAYVGEE